MPSAKSGGSQQLGDSSTRYPITRLTERESVPYMYSPSITFTVMHPSSYHHV